MASTSAIQIQDNEFNRLGLTKAVVDENGVTCYSRALDTASEKNPILVLIHGYPQSAYLWRHVVSLLPKGKPIFAPDLPGYGGSVSISKNDKLSAGTTVLNALKSEFKKASGSSSSGSIPVVLIGHDRGARVSHHLTVNGVAGVNILGTCLIDIVPTSTQWQHFADPATAAKQDTGYFHWPFLANADLANRMITAFGASNWCREMILSWSGRNPTGLEKLNQGDALNVYGNFLAQPHTLEASTQDYKEGATTDVEREQQNQKDGKKIKNPLLLLYSEDYIGSRYTFPDVWKEWVDEGVDVQHHGYGDGIGHFGAEENPEETVEVLLGWLKSVVH